MVGLYDDRAGLDDLPLEVPGVERPRDVDRFCAGFCVVFRFGIAALVLHPAAAAVQHDFRRLFSGGRGERRLPLETLPDRGVPLSGDFCRLAGGDQRDCHSVLEQAGRLSFAAAVSGGLAGARGIDFAGDGGG